MTSLPPKKSINYIIWIYHSLLILTVLFLVFAYFFKNEKIAYVDSAKIFNDYKASVEAKKSFQKKAKIWQTNTDTLTSEVKKSIQNYEKTMATMSPKEQALAKELIGTKQKQLADYQKAIQENARQENDKLTQGVVSQINSFLLQYGKKHNYKLILIANQSGTIAYARDGLDITTDVVEELNENYTANDK